MKTARTLINMPAAQGAIGDLFNFKLAPSLTLDVDHGVETQFQKTLVLNT